MSNFDFDPEFGFHDNDALNMEQITLSAWVESLPIRAFRGRHDAAQRQAVAREIFAANDTFQAMWVAVQKVYSYEELLDGTATWLPVATGIANALRRAARIMKRYRPLYKAAVRAMVAGFPPGKVDLRLPLYSWAKTMVRETGEV